jgi:hypothetical protein
MLLFHLIVIFFPLDTFLLKGINKFFFEFFLPFKLLVRGAKRSLCRVMPKECGIMQHNDL